MPEEAAVLRTELESQCNSVTERYPGYRADLLAKLFEILDAERDKSGTIRKDITRLVESLGTSIDKKVPDEA